jgi:DNA-directed RNA polymerase subunit E'
MYMITQAEKVVPIPPADLKDDISDVIGRLTCQMYEGQFNPDKTITVLINNVETEGEGRIVHGDGAVYQTVKFNQLVFKPKENEIIEGVVVEIVKFGAFIRFGPLDGLLHVSQVMNDRVDIDDVNQRLVGKDSGRFLAIGDVVRARVVSIDLNEKNPQDSKIGLTMRQSGLGKLDWIAEDEKKSKGEDAEDAAATAGNKKDGKKKPAENKGEN